MTEKNTWNGPKSYPLLFDKCHYLQLTFQDMHLAVALSLKCPLPNQ